MNTPRLEPICGATYTRPDQQTMLCTFLVGHSETRHSWWTVQQQDVADTRIDYTPTATQVLLDAITRGDLDQYLEAILAVTHHRKLALRNVAGFGNGRTGHAR